ncbi:unnamed protein product [Angiostrongylus costaricensis]|uniref:BTB domain-containing protein n=1 Tax=Angiostrongylus costaricensis TaxID=334426 RepID=A0A0R3PCT2_ANGCS|nr:unnamed protein product [Angiostrongylus costaricensis]
MLQRAGNGKSKRVHFEEHPVGPSRQTESHFNDPVKACKCLWFLQHEEKFDELICMEIDGNPFQDICVVTRGTLIKAWLTKRSIGLASHADKFESQSIFTLGDLASVYRHDTFARLGFDPDQCAVLNKAFNDWYRVIRSEICVILIFAQADVPRFRFICVRVEIVICAGSIAFVYNSPYHCRQTIKEELKDRRAAVMVEAADACNSIRKTHRSFADYKAKMIALGRPDDTVTASRKAMEKTIHEYYSDFFDSHAHLPSYEVREYGYVAPPVPPYEIRHAISSVKKIEQYQVWRG